MPPAGTEPPRAKAYSFDGDITHRSTDFPRQKTVNVHDVPIQPLGLPFSVAENSAASPVTSPPLVLQGRIASHPTITGAMNQATSHPSLPSGASTIPKSIQLSAPLLDGARCVANVTAPAAQTDAALGLMYPDFLRKRIVPGKHMVVPDEVDRSLLMETDRERLGVDASQGDIGALLKLKSEKLDGEEETRNKLTELALFALSGFGFFETKLGTDTYNREKKARILRHGQTDKDWLWENGLRVPISTRFAVGGASINWGRLSETTVHDDAILLGDCTPHTLDSYEAFVTDGKKSEARGDTPLTVDRFTRCAKQHIGLFCLLYVKEHRKERRDALDIMIELRETQPDLFTIAFLCQAWEAMSYSYLAEIKDGTRRTIRMLPDVVKKTDLRRKALSPGPSGRVLWEYPTTWLMSQPTGYWQGSVKPKLEERVSRATWGTILIAGLKGKRGVGGDDIVDKPHQDQYPAGMPLANEEIKASRAFRPMGGSGQSLCWDYATHAGCRAPAGQCTRGVRELLKLSGLHPLIKMHLSRRGGHRP